MENLNIEQNENQNMSQSVTSIPDKDSLEERYNKLRGLAVKLKKRVGDLTEQLQNLETEKQKIIVEKDELHNKFTQVTESIKTFQTIQLEYDKIQDKMEYCRAENKKLLKNTETLVKENTSLKQSLFNEKDTATSLTAKIELLTKEQNNLKSKIHQSTEEIKKLKNELKAQVVIRGQKDKDYDEIKFKLEAEINAHKNTKSQLDTLKQEHTSNNVLSLEVENYEKSIKEMKGKCAEELSKREIAEKSLEKHLEQIVALNTQISELQDDNLKIKKETTSLKKDYEYEKKSNNKLESDLADLQTQLSELYNQQKVSEKEKEKLCEQLKTLLNENEGIVKKNTNDKENNDKVIKELSLEITALDELLKQSKQETQTLREEFNGYKLRAQSVLRNKESSSTGGNKGKNIIELEEELEHSQFQNDILKEKLEHYKQKVESLTNDLVLMKDEKDHAFENRKELNEKLTNLRQEYRSLMEQNKLQGLKIQEVHRTQKEELEKLHNQYKSEINQLKEQHQSEILTFKSEYEKLLSSNSSKSEFFHSSHEKVSESNSDLNIFSRVSAPLIEREECEGSESIDSFSQMTINDERYRKHSLMPLDELLNSTDDYENIEKKVLSSRVNRQELEVLEHQVKHLTVLLADAERDIAKLTQQNELLKEDIRRQQRSAEREEHANNFEYLKNVVFKFVTLKNSDERSHLIPVLATILKLSPEEMNKLNIVAGISGKSWIPGWNN